MAKLKINITPSLQRLDLVVKGLVNTKFIGNYASAFKGQGFEFADYRVYTPNDDASLIDWKASNRARKLLVKEFVEERNINVVFIVDVSSKMLLGSVNKLKCEYIAELVSSFAYTVLKEGDFVGLMMCSDKIVKKVIATNGMKQFHIISEALSNLSYYGGVCNLKRAVDEALRVLEQNTLLIIISDFISFEGLGDSFKLASKKFDLIGIMVRDPIDVSLPEGMGQILVEDPIYREKMLISPNKFRKLYEGETRKEMTNLKNYFKEAGADLVTLYTNKPFVEELVSFFKMREARWR